MEILHIPVEELWQEIKDKTNDNEYVYNDDEYLEENYPELWALKKLIKKYSK